MNYVDRKKDEFLRAFGERGTYTIYYHDLNKKELNYSFGKYDLWFQTDSIENAKKLVEEIESGEKVIKFSIINRTDVQAFLFIATLVVISVLLLTLVSFTGYLELFVTFTSTIFVVWFLYKLLKKSLVSKY